MIMERRKVILIGFNISYWLLYSSVRCVYALHFKRYEAIKRLHKIAACITYYLSGKHFIPGGSTIDNRFFFFPKLNKVKRIEFKKILNAHVVDAENPWQIMHSYIKLNECRD